MSGTYALMTCPKCRRRYAVSIMASSGVVGGPIWAVCDASWLAEGQREGFEPAPFTMAAIRPLCPEPRCDCYLDAGVEAVLTESGDWLVLGDGPAQPGKVN